MKLNKKFLASFMALTMAAAPMSAYAAPYSINGTGTITILETEIYNVVLPTDKSIDFNVDPYGILTMDPGATLDDVVSKAAGIVTSSATAVINKSSVPIDVNMQFYFDQSNSAPASNAAVLLGSYDVVKAGNADLYLEVLPLSGATLEAGVPVATGAAITPADIGVPVSNKAVTLSDTPLSFTDYGQELSGVPITVTGSAASVTGTELKFSLKDVSYAYDVVTGGSANAVTAAAVLSESALSYDYRNVYAFAITGYASPASKDLWLAIQEADSDIKLTLKFTLSKADKITSSTTEVKCVNGAFDVYVMKSDLSGTPNGLFISINSKWYDISTLCTVDISDKGDYYKISVVGYPSGLHGTYNLAVTNSTGATVYGDATVTFD